MLKRSFIFLLLLVCGAISANAQESFYIKDFKVSVQVEKTADIRVTEAILVHFTEQRHGIIRKIPFRYKITALPDSSDKAQQDWVYNGYRYTKIKDINVQHFDYQTSKDGDYESIRIGSKDKYVDGDQLYTISYTIVGAINFFEHHSELYLNLTGNQWNVEIRKADFSIHFFSPLPHNEKWFVATGEYGSKANKTNAKWTDDQTLEGKLLSPLSPYQGITAGVNMPGDYLKKPEYSMLGSGWLLLPVAVFILMFFVWRRWGKDLKVTVQTEFYPPGNVVPPVAGYVIDGKLDRRDLTALVPYWGAGGYLKVNETESRQLFGLIKNKEYEFIKVKDLPPSAYTFEKTMFDGLFYKGDSVKLDDLKNTFYTTMSKAKKDLETEIRREHYYVSFSRTLAILLPIAGLFILIPSVIQLFTDYPVDFLKWISFILASLPVLIFGSLMTKKTVKGTELYEKLLGFKEFIKSVEQDKLKEFLKEDPNYFDKVLPFAIVFDVADTWKDKLKGLDVPPPSWYQGYYAGNTFNTMNFMNSLDNSMNAMSSTFYSAPASSGSSGGSFGGGGFSGGGFGGGGGSSW